MVNQGFCDSQRKSAIPLSTMAGMQDEEIFYACIYREVHSVKELKANLLIGIKILGPEEVVLDLVL